MSCPHNSKKKPSLQEVLDVGNETCGHDIVVSGEDKIRGDKLCFESNSRASYIKDIDYIKAKTCGFDTEHLSLSSANLTQIDSGGNIEIAAVRCLQAKSSGAVKIIAPITYIHGDIHVFGKIIRGNIEDSIETNEESDEESDDEPEPNFIQTSISDSPISAQPGYIQTSEPDSFASIQSPEESGPGYIQTSVVDPFHTVENSEPDFIQTSYPPESHFVSASSCPEVSIPSHPIPFRKIGVIQFGEMQDACTSGGPTIASQGWAVRTINYATGRNVRFVLENDSLIFQETGLYTISGFSSFFSSDTSTIATTRFSSITPTSQDDIRTVIGSNVYGSGNSIIDGMFTVSVPDTVFTLQYRASHSQCIGLGRPNEMVTNMYSSFIITKVG